MISHSYYLKNLSRIRVLYKLLLVIRYLRLLMKRIMFTLGEQKTNMDKWEEERTMMRMAQCHRLQKLFQKSRLLKLLLDQSFVLLLDWILMKMARLYNRPRNSNNHNNMIDNNRSKIIHHIINQFNPLKVTKHLITKQIILKNKITKSITIMEIKASHN